jgi:2-polyprenyl-3-methyl-5-hydroxy-6-metoxy-1,4-benzoquinol methylase
MKFYLQSNGYVFNQDMGLWQRPEYAGIDYSDGDEIENRLRNIVSGARDTSVMSVELAKYCTDWPSLYHLSRKRVNLLRPFEERLHGKSVLEIGAGCGAITRYLGELGAEVVALEGSLRRASILALRCRDLSNITVVGEVIHHFKPGPQFDVITLIGVLEYARKFFPGGGGDPVDAMLSYIKGLLKPGGTLIIAIENQLGL